MKNRDVLKLFIADDSIPVQSALANEIAKMRHILLAGQAFDVPQAILRIQESGAEIVILDMNMPGGSGLDVLKSLSQRNAGPVCIVFAFHLTDIVKDCCMRLGARACLRKPEDVDVLISALTAIRRDDLDALRAGTLSFQKLGGVTTGAPETPMDP